MKITRILLALAVLALPTIGSAQTNGTLATQTAQNWSTAPWILTGPGTYPDGGGTAEFDTFINNIIGTVPGTTVITMDVTPTISSFTYNSPFSYQLAAGAGGLNLDAGGATFNMILTGMSTPSLTVLADPITAVISGGGVNGLTKTGGGTLTLGGTNTYTGGTHINGGTLAISAVAAIGDATLGAAGAGNDISIDGGTLANNITGGWTTNRNIALGNGGGTLLLFTAATVNGVVSGSGSLTINNSTLTLTNTNTYLGATVLNSSFSGLTLSGNGSINQSTGIDLAGALTLTNTTTNNADRLNDIGTITDRGATIAMTGNAAAATNEVAGALVLANGVSTISVTPNAAQQASLNFSSITRQNNSTLYARGTNLGNAAGSGVAEITSIASPGTLIGGGGLAGTTNISILPWAAGNVSGAVSTNSSFLTWDSGTGQFRPLAVATEYSALTSGASTNDNTKVTAATAISAPTTVNSVLVTATGTQLTGAGGLNITSGALMYSPTNTTAGTISANINFGGAEGVISSTAGAANNLTAGLTISGLITGSAGVTLNSIIGSDIALTNANNSYTGTTTLLGGLTIVNGTIASGSNSIFGADTSAIVINSSNNSNLNGIYASAATTMNRDLSIVGSSNSSAFIVSSANIAFTENGNVNIAGNTRLDLYNTASGTAATGFIFNGNITGAGSIADNATATTFVTLNGANTYTGGTNIGAGATYQAGADSTGASGAFGTGTISFSGAGFIRSKDTTAHTIDNAIFLGATPTFSGTGALNFTGSVNLNGSRSVGVTDTAAAGAAFSGVVSNGALTKTGAGTLSLNNAAGNTYTGGTVLGNSAGILNVNNVSGSGTGLGTVSIGGTSVANRSTLSGNFTISGATSISGTLSPGNSVGTANFGSSLTLAVNSNSVIEIASAASFDHINVAGLLTLPNSATAGSFTFSISTTGGYDAPIGTTFDIVDWGTLASGTFNPATQIAFTNQPGSAGTTLDTSMFLTNGSVTVIPEPSTWAMMGAGASMLVAMMRLRRRSS